MGLSLGSELSERFHTDCHNSDEKPKWFLIRSRASETRQSSRTGTWSSLKADGHLVVGPTNVTVGLAMAIRSRAALAAAQLVRGMGREIDTGATCAPLMATSPLKAGALITRNPLYALSRLT
jgi:hypothetical protein